MAKCCFRTIFFALLAVSTGLAQETPATKTGDNGPSLEVTMKFIKDKVEAKAERKTNGGGGSPSIEADPATCELTEARNFHPGQLALRRTFSFREVETIEVSQPKDEDGDPEPDFVLKILMTTNTSVHERYTEKEKKANNVQVNGAK